MWAVGVGGAATGRGFHLGIVDDPIKDAEAALSERIRAKQHDWWDSTWTTRREPGAAMIVMLTRWHEDDLAGWLLRREDEEPEGWHVLSFEGIKTDAPPRFPASCVVEPDDRAAGEPLCEARVTLATMQKAQRTSAYWFSALYQQRPSPAEGGLWQRAWFARGGVVFDAPPPDLRSIAADWDLAYTKDDTNSASAYVRSGVDVDGVVYVLDVDWRWLEFPALVAWMRSVPGPHYVEQKASGKSAVQTLFGHGVTAIEVPVTTGDKVARTTMATPQAEAGRIRVARHVLDKLLDDEAQGILRVQAGRFTDLNDAFVQAVNRHTHGTFDHTNF